MTATQNSPDLRMELQLVVCSQGIRNHVQQRITDQPTAQQQRLLNLCTIVGHLSHLDDRDLAALALELEKIPHF